MITSQEEILQDLISLINEEEIMLLSYDNNGISTDVYCKKPTNNSEWFYPITKTFYLINYFDESFVKIPFSDILSYSVPIKKFKKEFLVEIENKKQTYILQTESI